MKNKIYLGLWITLLLGYVLTIFYLSEPKYINNCEGTPEKYDYVSLKKYSFTNEVENGIVLQTDSTYFLLKVKDYSEDFYQVDIKNDEYRVVGKGTIYHKVNEYIGFNIMMITQFVIVVLLCFILAKSINLYKQ